MTFPHAKSVYVSLPVNVVLDPLECGHLVQHAGIARDLLGAEGEEAQGPQPVVDGDQDDLVDHPEVRPKPAGGPAAEHEGPAMEPDGHREGAVRSSGHGGYVDVEVETVLGTAGQQAVIVQTKVQLRTDRVPLLQHKNWK